MVNRKLKSITGMTLFFRGVKNIAKKNDIIYVSSLNDKFIITLGGYKGYTDCMDVINLYDIKNDTWTELDTKLPKQCGYEWMFSTSNVYNHFLHAFSLALQVVESLFRHHDCCVWRKICLFGGKERR